MCDEAPAGANVADCGAAAAVIGGCCESLRFDACVDITDEGIWVDGGIPLLLTVVGVNGRMDLAPTSGDSRFVRESMVRGEADGDGTASGK